MRTKLSITVPVPRASSVQVGQTTGNEVLSYDEATALGLSRVSVQERRGQVRGALPG